MENEMVERVALALQRYDAEATLGGYDGMARAAIEAMREPTEAMRAAGVGRAAELLAAGPSTEYVANETWAAVIDAALKEPTPA